MKKILVNTFILACIVIGMFSVNVFASSGSGSLTVPKNGVSMVAVRGATRSGNWGCVYVTAKAVTPIPPYSFDNYTKCKACLYLNNNQAIEISDWYTLKEGEVNSKLYLKEGRLLVKKFNLNFKGNSNSCAAEIHYSYNGM